MNRLYRIIPLVLIAVCGVVSCSYVSDAVEGAITKRASFSIQGRYEAPNVIITWSQTDSGQAFAGFEIYRTSSADNEYASYMLVASRWRDEVNSGPYGAYNGLDSGNCASFSFVPTGLKGKYYFRIGIIHWDNESITERTAENGYVPGYSIIDPDGWDTESNYNNKTGIDSVSGYVEVQIP